MPTSQKQGVEPPTDGLNLPLPPVTLDFAIRGDTHRESTYQRYVRKGDCNDATSAIIGKGGFGTAYRFVRDDSFTPPSSMMDVTFSSADNDLTSGSELARKLSTHLTADRWAATPEGVGVVVSAATSVDASGPSSAVNARTRATQLQQKHSHSVPPSPPIGGTSVVRSNTAKRNNKAPAVVVVKVCRTPTSGSYDELPKTGAGRTEAKRAAQEVADGMPTGEHTRIVRGEARLLRFLQMCQSLKSVKSRGTHVVRLLADIPMPKSSIDGERNQKDEDENYNGPPVPRLLIFERLVDLDAELTPRGWSKSKQTWTIEKVEQVSKDAMAGLRFIHSHCVVHGDLKPSNFMRDARTGTVKLIDLGASRRWVRLHNMAKERTTAVEELDQAAANGQLDLQNPDDILCEGLGSLTGSPHFMAPEVLLQAGRYLAADGIARNVLDDYIVNKSRLPRHPSVAHLGMAHRDFKRGWGIKADIWSWGCSVLSLLHRTLPSEEKPSSSSVCAFDFSFDSDVDALPPLWPLHVTNDSLPRFHQWARLYALRIMSVVDKGIILPKYADKLSPPYMQMLRASMRQQDNRPSSAQVMEFLNAHTSQNVEYMSDVDNGLMTRAPSRALSIASHSERGLSLPEEPHNVDLSCSSSFMTRTGTAQVNTPETNLNLPTAAPSQFRIVHSHSQQRQTNDAATGCYINNMQSSHITSKISPSPQAKSVVLAPSPLQFDSSPDLMAMLQRSASAASSHHSSFASGSEKVVHAEPGANGSPLTSINTAMSTPTMLENANIQASSLKAPMTARIKGQYGELSRMEVDQHGASDASIEAWSSPALQRHRSLLQTNKPRRGSIFNRMASTLVPRMHHHYDADRTEARGQASRAEQNQEAPDWHMSSTGHGVQTVEYLEDQSSAAHQLQPQQRQQILPSQSTGSRSPPPVPTKRAEGDTGRKTHARKSSGYNVLGLDLTHALQSPLRTVRSLTSLRSASLPPGAAQNDAKLPDITSMYGGESKFAQSASAASPSFSNESGGAGNGGGSQSIANSQTNENFNGSHRNSGPQHGGSAHVARLAGISRGTTQSTGQLRSPSASSRQHQQIGADAGDSGDGSNAMLRQQQSVPSLSASKSPVCPSFLQNDPYPTSAASRSHAKMPADAATNSSWHAPSVSAPHQGRLRSWSSIFKRNKRPA